MKKTAALFDFDGVLVQSRRANKTYLWSENIASIGITQSVVDELFTFPEWLDVLRGKLSAAGRFEPVLRRLAPHLSVAQFIEYWLPSDLNWYQPALSLAQELRAKDHRLFVATNQDFVRGNFISAQPEIREAFEQVLFSAEFGAIKPEPEYFRKAQQIVSANPRDIVLIDDRPENIEAALQIGWQAVHFDPDLTGEGFEALKEKLRKVRL